MNPKIYPMYEMKSQWKYYQTVNTEQVKNWADCIKPISTVKTFPELLHTLDMTALAGLENLGDLNFFKNDTLPMWEDPVNKNGGRVIMEVPLANRESLHELWQKTVVFCALEVFETITGCVYAEKINFRISIWIGDTNQHQEVMEAWKAVLENEEATFGYTSHERAADPSRKARRTGFKSKN